MFITWRLHGSLPAGASGQSFRALDSLLDVASGGPEWLRNPRVAALAVSILRQGESERNWYRLAAFVVMSNHVHVLLEPAAAVAGIMQWIKGTTAREANRLLGRVGERFWQHESYDHWARNEREFQRIVRYIEFNPVAAGLVDRIENWPWSSAYAPVGQASACPTEDVTVGREHVRSQRRAEAQQARRPDPTRLQGRCLAISCRIGSLSA